MFFVILYILLLISRLVISRSFLETFFITGLLLFFFIFIKLFPFIQILFFKIKSYFIKSDSTKFIIFIEKAFLFFENEFVQTFLDNKLFLNKFFVFIMVGFIKMVKNYSTKTLVLFFIFFPWFFSIIIFFLEFLNYPYIYFYFYCVSLAFFIKKVFIFLSYIGLIKMNQMEKLAFQRFFPQFSDLSQTFFHMNLIFKKDLFFFQESLQKKDILIFLWKSFIEIDFWNFYKSAIFSIKNIHLRDFENFKNNFNIGFFLMILLMILIKTYSFLIFLLIFLPFFQAFLIFLLITYFFDFSMEHLKLNLILDDYIEKRVAFHEGLLEKYSFLKNSDIPLDFILPSITYLSEINLFFKDFVFNENSDLPKKYQVQLPQESEKLFKILTLLNEWFLQQHASNNIDKLTFQQKNR